MASEEPVKRIRKGDDCAQFKDTATFGIIKRCIEASCMAVQGVARTLTTQQELSAADPFGDAAINYFQTTLFPTLRAWVAEIPLHDMAKQRFGNKAYRDFHARLSEHAPSLMQKLVATFPRLEDGQLRDAAIPEAVIAVELAAYLKDSFGNSQRLDFGTGHELHFFVLVEVVLRFHGASTSTSQEDVASAVMHQRTLMQKMVLVVFWEYMEFMRLLQKHYSLEPAGSHGVWGLDDYHHLPFIFGAAQLIGFDDEEGYKTGAQTQLILPKHITDIEKIEGNKDAFLYFRCIAWIVGNKKGPFHEHSSVLYNVSGIDKWQRIASGMLRMYEAEVLLKFNVVQHFLFGQLMPYAPEP